MSKNINNNYILIEEIKGNKDLHEIAKKMHFKDEMGYLPKNTKRNKKGKDKYGKV